MYYLENILSYFPNEKVINMVRSQRDALLNIKRMGNMVEVINKRFFNNEG